MTTAFEVALSRPVTQAEFGQMVGVSQQAISALQQRGVIDPGATAGDWLRAYCAHLVDVAEGRASDGLLDLVQERAELARSQREAWDMRNAAMRAEFAPAELLSDCLAVVSDEIGERIDALMTAINIQCPGLPEPARAAVAQVVASAGKAWRSTTSELATTDTSAEAEDLDDSIDPAQVDVD
ncbi:MAG: hypothetical protein AB9M53_03600 [Leptothrix sp. (in: b-proteobacteria)]